MEREGWLGLYLHSQPWNPSRPFLFHLFSSFGFLFLRSPVNLYHLQHESEGNEHH